MNDIITNSLIGDKLIADSSADQQLAQEEIIDGFSFLSFEFETELKKAYEKSRSESIKEDKSTNGSLRSVKRSKTSVGRPKGVKARESTAASSTASSSSFNDEQITLGEPRPPDTKSPPPSDPQPPAKKPKIDEPKSSYDMNTLLAAAASAAATAAVVAATGSSKSPEPAPNPSPAAAKALNPPSSSTYQPPVDPTSFINRIMEMCKQQIPNLNIPGLLKPADAEPAKSASPTTSKQLSSPAHSYQNHHHHHQPNQPARPPVNTTPYSNNFYMPPYPKPPPLPTDDFLRRDLDAKFHSSMSMARPSSSKEAFVYSQASKAKPVPKAAGLTQYHPRTSGKWCAAHAKIANMIQEQKQKPPPPVSIKPPAVQQQPQPHTFSSSQFDPYHSKKLHTPTFFPPVQHNLKQSKPQAPPPPTRSHHNYLATEAAITAAANHHLMMDKYRHDMMRLPMPGMPGHPLLPPPGVHMPMPPPPGLHMPMPPFVGNKKPPHPSTGHAPPPPLPPSHMSPFNPNPLVQHSFLQQFFMDKNFDPTRFPMPPPSSSSSLPPGCLMPSMLKPDDKHVT